MLTASSPALPLSYRAAARASASSARSMRLAPIRAQVHPPVRAPSRCYIGATLPALPLSSPLEALFGETSSIVLKILLCVAGCETADLTSQTPEAEKQPESVQKVSLEQSSAPSAEMQSNIAAQDKAPSRRCSQRTCRPALRSSSSRSSDRHRRPSMVRTPHHPGLPSGGDM